jgi:exodeoxyribonuclease V alpha subunit
MKIAAVHVDRAAVGQAVEDSAPVVSDENVTIDGHIMDIRFERDGFVILRFGVDGKSVSALGNMIRPEPGMSYRLRGKWDPPHPVFGRQFRFTWYETVQPRSTEGIYKYLVRIAKWVGPSVGNRLVERYGTKTLDILKKDPARVAGDVSGITLARAKEIQRGLREGELTEAAVVDLEQVFAAVPGLRRGLAMDCVATWGANAVEIVKRTPYRLMELRGIGFLTADKVAISVGVDPAGIDRERACVVHVIEECMQSTGSTWVGVDELATECLALIGRDCADGLRELVLGADLVLSGCGMVSTRAADEDESAVARQIVEILVGPFEANEDGEEALWQECQMK